MNGNVTELEQVVTHIEHNIERRTDWPRGIGEHNSSPHYWILTSASVDSSPRTYPFTSATVRVSVYTPTKSGRNLSDKWRSTFTNGPAQLISITKTVPKSPSLWYGFRRRMSCPVGCEHSQRIEESVRHWGWGKKGLQKEASNWPLQGKLSYPLWTSMVLSTSALHKCHCLKLSRDYVALGLVLKKKAQGKKIVHN